MGTTILELFLGAVIAILTTIVIEHLRKPKIVFSIDQPKENNYHGKPVNYAKFLGICVTNKPLRKYLNCWLARDVASDCHGYITFFDKNKNKLPTEKLIFRWANSPEPIAMKIFIENKEGYLLDPMRLKLDSVIDIPPGDTEMFGVVARFENEKECYGWSNESYFSKNKWRDDKRIFQVGEYYLEITLFFSGNVIKETFKLINTESITEFKIEKT